MGTPQNNLALDFIINRKAKFLFLSSSKYAVLGQPFLRSQYWKLHIVSFVYKMFNIFASNLKYLCTFFLLVFVHKYASKYSTSNSKHSVCKNILENIFPHVISTTNLCTQFYRECQSVLFASESSAFEDSFHWVGGVFLHSHQQSAVYSYNVNDSTHRTHFLSIL